MKDGISPREALERKSSPSIFFNEVPEYKRKRIISSEQENGQKFRAMVRLGYRFKKDWEMDFTTYLASKLPDVVSLGGRIYADVDHIEFARAECSSPLEAVVHEDAFDRYGFNLLTSKLRLVRKLYKNSVDFGDPFLHLSPVSFGFHENYSTSIAFSKDNPGELLRLVPHLISRTIFGGTGSLLEMNKYLRAQRSIFINHLWSSGTFKDDRGILCTRTESHTEIPGLNRLHLICGDPLISPVNRFLLYGTTATVLDLFEDGKLPSDDYDSLYAIEDFHGITRDPKNYILKGYPDKNRSALDVQKELLERAAKEYEHRDLQTDAILHLWEDTLDKLDNDPFQLVGRLDCITKQALYLSLDDKFPDVSEDSFWQMRGIDMDYHDLNPNKSIFQALKSEGIMEDLYSQNLFSWYSQNPPPKTRAHFRGNLAKILQKHSRNIQVLDGDEWDRCNPFPGIYPEIKELALIDNPFDNYHGLLCEIRNHLYQIE